jgi:hypothetical protein
MKDIMRIIVSGEMFDLLKAKLLELKNGEKLAIELQEGLTIVFGEFIGDIVSDKEIEEKLILYGDPSAKEPEGLLRGEDLVETKENERSLVRLPYCPVEYIGEPVLTRGSFGEEVQTGRLFAGYIHVWDSMVGWISWTKWEGLDDPEWKVPSAHKNEAGGWCSPEHGNTCGHHPEHEVNK